jgi:hypothetical protein
MICKQNSGEHYRLGTEVSDTGEGLYAGETPGASLAALGH